MGMKPECCPGVWNSFHSRRSHEQTEKSQVCPHKNAGAYYTRSKLCVICFWGQRRGSWRCWKKRVHWGLNTQTKIAAWGLKLLGQSVMLFTLLPLNSTKSETLVLFSFRSTMTFSLPLYFLSFILSLQRTWWGEQRWSKDLLFKMPIYLKLWSPSRRPSRSILPLSCLLVLLHLDEQGQDTIQLHQ